MTDVDWSLVEVSQQEDSCHCLPLCMHTERTAAGPLLEMLDETGEERIYYIYIYCQWV